MYSDTSIRQKREFVQTILIEDLGDTERGFAKGPERALMSALLFDGVVAYMNFACSGKFKGNSRYKEAYIWVNSRGTEYIFSFDNVCEGLGIDPDSLRYGLINACNSRAYEWKRARRNF